MDERIDISVIIPMYNAENYIVETIDSINKQAKHGLKIEILVVDDVSQDNSKNIVKNLNNKYIRMIELEKNGGTANARNIGIKEAKGEWIQFMDSDDKISLDLYQKFEQVQKPDFNCYLFSLIIEYKDYTLKQTINEIKDKRAFGNFGGVWNKFIRRDICIEFEGVSKQNEDTCFVIDMMIEKDLKCSLIKDAYYVYNRKNEQSKISNFNKKEYLKMYNYVYNKVDKCDDHTKMFILEIFVALIFNPEMPFMMSLKIAIKTLLRLFKYLPSVLVNQNRHYVTNIKY
jgi:glycosyltransferase involved in cell wall biosynthesis